MLDEIITYCGCEELNFKTITSFEYVTDAMKFLDELKDQHNEPCYVPKRQVIDQLRLLSRFLETEYETIKNISIDYKYRIPSKTLKGF